MPKRPNILFILTDQQRYDSLACYGNDWIQVPTLNALAEESFVFDAAYVTQPVCTPARASIMTGLYPQSTGLPRNNINLPTSVPVIAEMAPEEYYSAHFGKWHLGDDTIKQRGFDHWVSVEDFHRARYSKREYRNVEADYNQHLRDHGVEVPSWKVSYEGWVAGANLPEEVTLAGFLGK
jgi:arylsulfatase A-like enzyme